MRRVNTAEIYYRDQLTIIGILTALLIVMVVLPFCSMGVRFTADDLPILLLMFIVGFGPMLAIAIVYLARYIHYRSVELTEIQTVRLGRVYSKRMSRVMGFEIDVTYNGRERRGARTAAVFMTRNSLTALSVDNYSDRIVEVGYDEKKDEWIVLM